MKIGKCCREWIRTKDTSKSRKFINDALISSPESEKGLATDLHKGKHRGKDGHHNTGNKSTSPIFRPKEPGCTHILLKHQFSKMSITGGNSGPIWWSLQLQSMTAMVPSREYPWLKWEVTEVHPEGKVDCNKTPNSQSWKTLHKGFNLTRLPLASMSNTRRKYHKPTTWISVVIV